MALKNFAEIVADARERAGFGSDEEAEAALLETASILAERLLPDESASLARALPEPLAGAFRTTRYDRDFGIGEFFERVAAHEPPTKARPSRRGFGLEHAMVACAVLGDALDDETKTRLVRHLGPAWARLFEPPRDEPGELPPHGVRQHEDEPERSLSGGRPGARRPLAESNPDRAQSQSVARTDNPHGATKLSSTRGTTQEREHDTIADAQRAPR